MSDPAKQPHPVLAEFNPYEPSQARDPYPMYAHAREQAPLFFSPVLKMWVATRYDDINAIAHDTARFSNQQSVSPLGRMPPEVGAIFAQGYPIVPKLVDNDPPGHTRVRRLCNTAFTPPRVAAMEPRIRQWTNELVDAFVEAGQADLMAQLAYPLPRIVIADIVGVPRADVNKFGQWSEEWTTLLFAMNLPVERQIACASSAVALQKYVAAMIAERRAQPQDDFLSDLVHAQEEDAHPLSDAELIGIINGFLIAGHLTTSDMLGNALVLLLNQPELWHSLCDDPDLAPSFIEEVLRRDSSVPGMMRMTVEDVTFNDVFIPKGSRVFLAFSSANHDEAMFPNPTRFDAGRDNLQKHLAFGQGIHYCIGAPLARLEGRIVLEVLSQRLPNLRFQPDEPLTYTPSLLFHGPERLPLIWDTASQTNPE